MYLSSMRDFEIQQLINYLTLNWRIVGAKNSGNPSMANFVKLYDSVDGKPVSPSRLLLFMISPLSLAYMNGIAALISRTVQK